MKPTLLALCVALIACGEEPTSSVAPPPSGFDDHTVSEFADAAAFLDYADLGETPIQVKFILSGFPAGEGELHALDPRFYALHDEWYYFRLLNGQPVKGAVSGPARGLVFHSIAEIYDAYRSATELPLDLRWFGTRLASDGFYSAALGRCDGQVGACERHFGLGSFIHLPADPGRATPEAIWAFELEYIDTPDVELVARYRARLQQALPAALRGELRWLARSSAHQEALAATLRAQGDTAVLTYADLVKPGETVAYNPGVTAGHIVRIPKGTLSKAALKSTDIVVLEEVPDELPPVAGIITAVPQTPQAHFNLLAVARGTPNAYVGGAESDAVLAALAADRRPVALDIRDGGVRWHPLTSQEWATWKSKKSAQPPTLVPANLDGLAYTRPLEAGSVAEARAALPAIGGKAAGLLALLSDPENPTPYRPLSITVRAYAEHLAPHRATLAALLADDEFLKDRRTRYLALEGFDAFRAAHASDPDALSWVDAFASAEHSPAIVKVLANGGVQGLVRRPIAAGTQAAIGHALEERFAALAPDQGLRFRSSSTAEDVDGFNGAGVYTSETGWLAPPEGKEERTVEAAILEVWASFWGFAAFEERAAAGIAHLDGRMAILVHPRFQDEAEIANGVILVGFSRSTGQPRLSLTVNVQAGALSVTNPPPGSGIVPEVDTVREDGTIDRLQPSSETSDEILTDAELRWLAERLEPLADAWLHAQNAELPPGEAALSVTLDLEFRKVGPEWPSFSGGPPAGAATRIVLKQVRPLSRAPRFDAVELGGAQVPADVSAAAERVERLECTAGPVTLEVLDVSTDASATLLPFHAVPFFARAIVGFPQGWETVAPGQLSVLGHHQATLSHPDGGILVIPPEGLGWSRFELLPDGAWQLEGEAVPAAKGTGATCKRVPVAVTAEAWLLSLFPS